MTVDTKQAVSLELIDEITEAWSCPDLVERHSLCFGDAGFERYG